MNDRFMDSLPRGSLIYDVGCGNGKYLLAEDALLKVIPLSREHSQLFGSQIGTDRCMGLCEIAAGKGANVFRADIMGSFPLTQLSISPSLLQIFLCDQ